MPPIRCILLVDDDPTTNYLNRKLLHRLAVSDQVQMASNGHEALAMLTASCTTPDAPACPALILLDVNMPVMNGFEFLDAYRQLPLAQQHAVVIIMLTTSLHPRDVQRAGTLPVAGFLTKPLTAEKVTQLVAEYFPTT
jgi:CheY-like chemotaxis protein